MIFHTFTPAPSPRLPRRGCMRTGGAKSIRRNDMIRQTYQQFNKSAFYHTIFHIILYTKVNKTDNYGALIYKQKISGQNYKQPSITRRLRQRRRIPGVWGSQPPAPLLKQTKSEHLANR